MVEKGETEKDREQRERAILPTARVTEKMRDTHTHTNKVENVWKRAKGSLLYRMKRVMKTTTSE